MLDKIRDFKILNKIGEGGMGSVYLAEDTMLDRKVALKVLNPVLTQEAQFTDRFRQEAKMQAGLIHPNIVALYTFFCDDEKYCMVMEFAEGNTLKEVIRDYGPIPEERASKILKQMFEGLGYAHSRGVIHRDIKPSNIIIDQNDNVKIMDFGIAKILGDKGLTKTGTKMGTVYYMSPEQIRASKDIDQRSDIYSLGVTFYEMLTGKLPFNTDTESDFEIMEEIIHGTFPDIKTILPSAGPSAIKVLNKMIEKEKNNRYTTCYQCSEELKSNSYSPPTFNPKPSHEKVEIKVPVISKETVNIVNQELLEENLNFDHYQNGDPIPEVQNAREWESIKTGAWCYYKNDPENGKKYGKLYNFYAISDPRALIPQGWHIPSIAEFSTNKKWFSALLAGNRLNDGSFNYLGISTFFWSLSEFGIKYASGISIYGKNIEITFSSYDKGNGFSVRCLKD